MPLDKLHALRRILSRNETHGQFCNRGARNDGLGSRTAVAVFQWDGASIPIVSTLARISGAAPLLVGFGQGEDRIHSPNESFSWRQFALGRRWAHDILEALCL